MKKSYKVMLVIVLCIAFSLSVYASDMLKEDYNNTLRGIACDKCGGSLYNSNKTFSDFIYQDVIDCACVQGHPGENDFKRTYNVYNTYVCSGCGDVTPRNFIGTQNKYWCPTANAYYNYETGHVLPNRINQKQEVILRSSVCQCGGYLLPTNTLILSNNHEIANYTVECKQYPGTFQRDEVWRYYFYNTYTCNKCNEIYERSKTQYYEDWGFCSHGSGKYPLHIIERIAPDNSNS